MPILLHQLIDVFEKIYPPYLAEPNDRIGLQIGDPNQPVRRVLLTLDITPAVVQEAVKDKSNLIISHHPLIYQPISTIVTNSPITLMITQLIKNNIAVYIAHTHIDFAPEGTTKHLATLLGLQEQRQLIPFDKPKLKKLVVFIPTTHLEKVAQAMFDAGAGIIGNYSECSFRTEGTGTFRPGVQANPFLGKVGEREYAAEVRLETIVPEVLLSQVISAMVRAHPYEEVAYDIYPLDNPHPQAVVCISGKLASPIRLMEFAHEVKSHLKLDSIRIVGNLQKRVQSIAVIAGSGMNYFDTIKKHPGIDVFITGDIKYHQAREAESLNIALLDIGHYPAEMLYLPILRKKLATALSKDIELIITSKCSNPFIIA
ncbi:MAG: Nif3-like dinuclear metal center hexameric protein [bacterium]|nr:Nif3-like dinuclear metal center hexameric protein [bacterium]